MLARAAEKLYWMARYLERAENTARLINSSTHMLLDLPIEVDFDWHSLVQVVGLDSLFTSHYPEANEENIMNFLIADRNNPSSILSCVQFARENTRTLREVLPAEMWERINSLYLYVKKNAMLACSTRRERYLVLNNIIEQRHAIIGLCSGVMAHDTPYHLIKLGRNVERADMTTRILDLHSVLHLPQDHVLYSTVIKQGWMSMLNALSAYQTYRRLVSMQITDSEVIAFLLSDTRFPRSVQYCLIEISACLKQLPKSHQLQQQVTQLMQQIEQRFQQHAVDAAALHQYVDQLQRALGELHNILMQTMFHVMQPEPALN